MAERTAELESFAYSVSHDLRAPFRAMQGFAQDLLEDCADKLNSVGRDFAGGVVTSARRMDALIHDLLDYSRLSRAELPLRPVSLAALMAEVLGELDAELRECGARVTVQEPLLDGTSDCGGQR